MFNKLLFVIIILFFFNLSKPSLSKEIFINEINKIKANIVFLRHSFAPGFGDPVNFKINDCSTQRNLSMEGVLQAREIGNFLIGNNIEFTEILSSEWCRCVDTIKEMNIGDWKTFSGLNSFFQNFTDKKNNLLLLNKKINSLSEDERILLITHQVVISEVTNISPPSGGIVIYNSKSKMSKLIKNFLE